jgi:hypothetical protein
VAWSGDEQRRWRELAAQLRHDWRLIALAARADDVFRWRRDLAAARTDAMIPAVTWLPVGACLGLVIPGGLARSNRLSMAGTAAAIAILIVAGGPHRDRIAGCHRPHRYGDQ